jgi:hypothetical protein
VELFNCFLELCSTSQHRLIPVTVSAGDSGDGVWVEQVNHSSQIAMANALITIQKIMTAPPLIAFALMSPMPEDSKSEKLWRLSSRSVNSS